MYFNSPSNLGVYPYATGFIKILKCRVFNDELNLSYYNI